MPAEYKAEAERLNKLLQVPCL